MWDYVSTEGVRRSNTSFMHAKHLYIPHLARPLSAKAYGVSQCLVFALERIAQTDCSEGLLKRIAWWVLVGAQVGVSIGFSSGGLICRVRGSQVSNRALGAGNTSTWLGSQKSGGVGARVGGLRSRLVWESVARGVFAACAVERLARCAAGQRAVVIAETFSNLSIFR